MLVTRRTVTIALRFGLFGHDADESQGMPDTAPLKVFTAERDGVLRVVAQGQLDLSTAHLLDEALSAAEATDARQIVLDIEAVEFIDSSGLRALLLAHARSQRDSNRLRVTRGAPQARRLFALVAVEQRLPFIDAPPTAA
jgi:anti-sigma B factor antagonist